MKRKWHRSNSEDSNTCSTSTSWSKLCESRSRWHNGEKPSEVFRTDLITAMKLHDSCHLGPEDYYVLADSWKQDWEKGVQVPVSPKSIPQAVVRTVGETSSTVLFKRPKKMIRLSSMDPSDLGYVGIRTLAEAMCRYDLDEQDVAWLQYANRELDGMGMQPVDENTMEKVMEEFERSCYDCLSQAMETEEGLGIEYDEDVVCDVCFSPHGEDDNEMVFCDKCNVCVHQACYGILKVPKGSWLCRICALGILPRCLLCPKRGGAMKSTRSGTKWTHVSCALWIPEVCIGNPESMEPITNISHIPNKRWSLSCCLCKDRSGACIQCSAKGCRVAFHVTCGQQASLKMSTVLTEADEVKFKSFCPKHSGLKTDEEEVDEEQQQRGKQSSLRTGRKNRETSSNPRAAVQKSGAEGVLSERKQRLQQLEDGFYRFVSPGNVAKHLGLPGETVDFVFQYWKLKRRVNFNRPLITPKREEEESLARREQEVLMRRLRLFTHLRQDLERVRNLAYMVTRREKIKRSVCRIQEQIFQQHTKMLEKDRFKGLSTTRRLSEALFYFRVPSSVPCSSPRPLKGHLTSNTPTEPPSPAPQTSLIPPEEPPDPGLKTEERKPDKAVLGGDVGAHRPSESFSPTPKTPKTNGILKGKTLRTNGLLQSQKAQDVKGVITAQVALKTERHSESERSVDMRRVTRGDSTKAASTKPQNFQDKGTVSNGSSTVSLGKYVRSGDLASGITHLSPNLVPTLCLTPVIVPPNMQSYSQLESKKRLKEPSSVQSKLRNGPRSSEDGLRTRERPISESMAKTTEMKAPAAAVTEDTKSNGGLRRSASSVSKLATGTEKDWGSFHIPKKRDLSGRAQPGGGLGGQLTLRQRTELPSCPRRTSDRTSLVIHSTPPTLRTRLRVSLENHVDNSVGNNQAHKDGQIKRCQTQRLRSQELMARRYGSDIIR